MKKILDEVLSIDELAYETIMEAYPNGSFGEDLGEIISTVGGAGSIEQDILEGHRLIGRGYGNITNTCGRFVQGQIFVTTLVEEIRVVEGPSQPHLQIRTDDGDDYTVLDIFDVLSLSHKPICDDTFIDDFLSLPDEDIENILVTQSIIDMSTCANDGDEWYDDDEW